MTRSLSNLALVAGMMFATVNQAAAAPANGEADQPAVEEENQGHTPEYTPFDDLTGIQNLKTGGLRYTFGPLPGGGFGFSVVEVERYQNGVHAQYDAATGDITYLAPGGPRVTFTAADEVPGQSTPLARLFNKPNPAGGVFGGSLTTPRVNAVPLSYTRFGTFFSTGPGVPLDGHAFVLGEYTRSNDLPKMGTASYTTSVGGSAIVLGAPAPHNLTGSTATFSANFATGDITTGINLVATPIFGGARIALDRLSGIGSISGPKPGFTGVFTGSGSVEGSFSGAFFGPKAVEFGYSFLVGGTSGLGRRFTAIGGVAGSTAIAPPPPPPPPVYTPFAALTGVQNFASAGVGYGQGPVPSGGSGFHLKAVETLGTGVAVQLDTGSGAITFTAPNGASTTFTAANVVATTPTTLVYNKPNPAGGIFGGSFTTPSVSGVPLSYTRFASFFTAGTPAGFDGHAFVFGVQTQASDVPTTGVATYSGGAGGTALLATGGSQALTGTASLTADFSTGSISTVLSLLRVSAGVPPTPLDILTGTGSLGSVKPGFAGTLTGSGSVTGNFAGAFFGPQAAEFGYDFLIGGVNAQGLGFTAVGAAAGTKP